MRFSFLVMTILCGFLTIFSLVVPASTSPSANGNPATAQGLDKVQVLQNKYLARLISHNAIMTRHLKTLHKLVDDMSLASDLSFEYGRDVDMEALMKWMSKLSSKAKIDDALKVSKDMIEETQKLSMWMMEFNALFKNTSNQEKNESFQTQVKPNLIRFNVEGFATENKN